MSIDKVRAELIRLLAQDDWLVADAPRRDAKALLPEYKGHSGECAVIEFILDKLREGLPLEPVQLREGEPAYVMKNADGRGLYIKVKFEDNRVAVLSFHTTRHKKK